MSAPREAKQRQTQVDLAKNNGETELKEHGLTYETAWQQADDWQLWRTLQIPYVPLGTLGLEENWVQKTWLMRHTAISNKADNNSKPLPQDNILFFLNDVFLHLVIFLWFSILHSISQFFTLVFLLYTCILFYLCHFLLFIKGYRYVAKSSIKHFSTREHLYILQWDGPNH